MRLYWESTNIGNSDLNLQIAEDPNGKYLLRLDTQSNNPKIQDLSNEAHASGSAIDLKYNKGRDDNSSNEQDAALGDDILNKTSDYIYNELNRIKRDHVLSAHISPILNEALQNMHDVSPVLLRITGYGKNIIGYYILTQQA